MTKAQRLGGAVAVALLLLHGSSCLATSIVPTTLASMDTMAAFVFGGTVSDIQHSSDRGSIIAHIRFRDLQMAKGALPKGKRLILHSKTGIDGQPLFRVGRRYVILAVPGLGMQTGIPIVGVHQGYFPILADSVTGRQVVHDSKGWPVAEVHDGRVVLVPPAPPLDPSTRLTEEQFLAILRSLAPKK